MRRPRISSFVAVPGTPLDNSTNSGHYEYEYTYDKVGNRTTMSVTDSSGTEQHVYTYDDIYQVTAVDYPAGYNPALATDTTFNYDDAGNRTSVIDSGGTSTYVTNALNQYTSVAGVSYTYDTRGNMTYDGANMYAYDPENRLTTVRKVPEPLAAACDIALAFTTSGAANWFSQTAESYNDNDAVQSGDIGDDQETVLEATVEGTGTVTFWWKTSTEVGDEAAFYIDGAYKTGRSGISGWNQVSKTITTTGTHTLRWKYMKDSSGSSGSDCIWVDYVQWSGTMPSLGSWSRIAYTYDPAGRRIEKKVDGTTQVKYVYDGPHIVAEYNNAGTLLRKYVHGPCTDEPICMIESSGTYAGTHYYHYDALGSCVAMTNSAGNVVQLYEYSVYGQVAASDADHPNRFMFTGREFDKDTGLYYYRARYYNPEIGRFLQTDPIGYGDGMNWYVYCSNKALSKTDPSGLEPTYFRDPPYYKREENPGNIYPPVPYYGAYPGPYFMQHQKMSCVIASTLNLCLTVGSQPTAIAGSNPLALGAPVNFTDCETDWQAEKWVEAQFEALEDRGDPDIGGYGFKWAAPVLGDGWTYDASCRITRGSILAKVGSGKAVMIAVDNDHGPGRSWHAIVIVPTPKTHPAAEFCPFLVVDPGLTSHYSETEVFPATTTHGDAMDAKMLSDYLKSFADQRSSGIKQTWIYQN